MGFNTIRKDKRSSPIGGTISAIGWECWFGRTPSPGWASASEDARGPPTIRGRKCRPWSPGFQSSFDRGLGVVRDDWAAMTDLGSIDGSSIATPRGSSMPRTRNTATSLKPWPLLRHDKRPVPRQGYRRQRRDGRGSGAHRRTRMGGRGVLGDRRSPLRGGLHVLPGRDESAQTDGQRRPVRRDLCPVVRRGKRAKRPDDLRPEDRQGTWPSGWHKSTAACADAVGAPCPCDAAGQSWSYSRQRPPENWAARGA